MGFRENVQKKYAESYFKKNSDRIVQIQGNAVSVKLEEKTILWVFHKLSVTILVRPASSKSIAKCVYKRNRWFKKPTFIPVLQGNLVLIQGMKGKKGKEGREIVTIMNLMNLTTKKDLIPMEGKNMKPQKMQTRYK